MLRCVVGFRKRQFELKMYARQHGIIRHTTDNTDVPSLGVPQTCSFRKAVAEMQDRSTGGLRVRIRGTLLTFCYSSLPLFPTIHLQIAIVSAKFFRRS